MSGDYHSPACRAFWIRAMPTNDDVGLIRLYDLLDQSAMFDLRIKTRSRGAGIDTQAVRWQTAHVFATYPGIIRLEGQTRQDNTAMRKVFRASGYVKEPTTGRVGPQSRENTRIPPSGMASFGVTLKPDRSLPFRGMMTHPST